MPYASNQGVRIHYEVEGKGPPLVLRHGVLNSVEDMRHVGWVDGLKDSYRLVLVDVRGHGASDKPHDPAAYGWEAMARDVVAVLDQEGIPRSNYFGYSMGGGIGFALAKVAPQRLISLILGGVHPYWGKTSPYWLGNPAAREWADQLHQAARRGMVAWVTALEGQGTVFDAETKARRLANDAEALAAYIEASRSASTLEDVLPTMRMPCLLYAGENDALYPGARECAKHIQNATFVSLPGLGHGQAGKRIDVVLPHVRKFLAEVTEAEGRVPKGTKA